MGDRGSTGGSSQHARAAFGLPIEPYETIDHRAHDALSCRPNSVPSVGDKKGVNDGVFAAKSLISANR